MKQSPEKAKPEEARRKQIESTLNELHRLQAEIYELNIPENPHSNPPVKKEIKQLAYLYENMTSTPAATQSPRPGTASTSPSRTSRPPSSSSSPPARSGRPASTASGSAGSCGSSSAASWKWG